MDWNRRSLLKGGAVAVGGAAAALATTSPAQAAQEGDYIWALNTQGVLVPSDTWVMIPWTHIVLNTSPGYLDAANPAVWVFPTATASGIWAIVCNIAWDNATGPDGQPINPPIHRKLARIIQQNTATPQNMELAYAGSSTDLTYHPDLGAIGDQDELADGSDGYQQQQVYIQIGFQPTFPDQRTWIEVYQNSGQPLVARFNGGYAPHDGNRPPIVGWQAPSLLIAKISEY